MRYAFTALSIAALTLAAGCTTGPLASAPPPAIGANTGPVGGTCDAQGAKAVVGQNSTAKTVEDARVRSGAVMARVLRPGQMVTKEFDAQRLNLDVDANGRIIAARCG
ncbi:MAG: proteinase inhibitor I78 [Comamonadaceae bacterium]|nr:MAG: proteinase inhibitor I78 [Comamonadaceae bacterium]